RDLLYRLRTGIGDGDQLGAGHVTSEVLGVQPPDATAADHSDADRSAHRFAPMRCGVPAGRGTLRYRRRIGTTARSVQRPALSGRQTRSILAMLVAVLFWPRLRLSPAEHWRCRRRAARPDFQVHDRAKTAVSPSRRYAGPCDGRCPSTAR